MATRSSLSRSILNRIIDFYLKSADFNGIPVKKLLAETDTAALEAVKKLVVDGKVEVYSSEYDNPHIKRMPAQEVSKQLEFLDRAFGEEHVCLYPSVKAMRRVLPSNKYRTKPFTRFLALGHPHLEPLFFQLGVLGRYQHDPRYSFRFDKLSGKICIKSDASRSREIGDADKVVVQTFGLGTSAKRHRVVVTFPRYLSDLSSRHQQHWYSFRVPTPCKMERNYALRGLYGQWTDGESIYDALLLEMSHINKMCETIGLPKLFLRDYSVEARNHESDVPEDEPKAFGLIMPTKKSFLEFAAVLDKIISENLNHDFFRAQGIETQEEREKDGKIIVAPKGTLRMLEEWLTKFIRMAKADGPKIIVSPLKKVRELRQSPAHKFVNDEFSIEYQHKKEELIQEVYIAISNIRMFFQKHPKAKDYPFPEWLKPENLVIF